MIEPASARDDWDRHWTDYAGATEKNPAQLMRRQLVLSLLGVGSARARILDVGSGQGDLLLTLRRAYPEAELLGIEYSRAGIDLARGKLPEARYVCRDLLKAGPPEPGLAGWASHAVCSEVLEHVDDPISLLRQAAAYMAAGCLLVVTVPGGPMSSFDRHIGHRRHFTASGLAALLRAAGFDVEMVAAAGFPFFNLYRLVVILRGRALVADVRSRGGVGGGLAGIVMAVFRVLFRLNLGPGRLGWQIVGVARRKDV